jgi:hypothetical protein
VRLRITLVASRRLMRRTGWAVSLLLAGGLGWSVGRFANAPSTTRPDPGLAASVVPAPPAPETLPASPVPVEAKIGPPPERDATPRKRVDRKPVEPRPAPRPEPPAVATVDEPPAQATAPVELPAPAETVLERASRVDRLAANGQAEEARTEAGALLAELPTPKELVVALVANGATETAAQLHALRTLQLAGHDAASRDYARELKRSHAGTPEIIESIERWGALSPRIVAVESSIAGGDQVVVTGTLENPDIGEVRRVRVVVEALDAAGSLLARIEARVRPKVIAPGGHGEFTAGFGKLDPAAVLHTRTILVAWESEVRNEG